MGILCLPQLEIEVPVHDDLPFTSYISIGHDLCCPHHIIDKFMGGDIVLVRSNPWT